MNRCLFLISCPPTWTKTPPLSLEYLYRYLSTRGLETRAYDLNIATYNTLALTKKEWLSLNRLKEKSLFDDVIQRYPFLLGKIINISEKYDVIGFSLTGRNRIFTLKLANYIKNRFPEKEIIIGGPEVLFMKIRKEVFSPQFTWVIGEGEKALLNVLKDETHEAVVESEEIDNLDTIPFLDFTNLNPSVYSNILPLLSSRGCIRKCRFCTERLLFKKFRQHSPRYMIDQIKFLINKHNLPNFTFQDSLINANLIWLEEFCRLVIENKLNIKWEAQAIVRDDFPESLARLMKKAGCFNLFIGLESASDKVLAEMNKGFTQRCALNFFNTLKKGGLHFEVSIIAGYPQETEKDFDETITFIIKNKNIIPKIAQVNPYINYFAKDFTPHPVALQRVTKLVTTLHKEKIPYTKSFINNLIYPDGN